MSAQEAKDTVYIDVDDEITGIIDKVSSSDHKIVALVLPKRATVLQSLVNMKLLKRAADNAKKRAVLITSEAGLMPLAGAAGLHVAGNLQAKPAIPQNPENSNIPDELINEDEVTAEDQPLDPSKSVGELATATAAKGADEPIDIDNSDDTPAKAAAKKPAKDKNKKFKIPNFKKFRLLLILGGIGLLLLLLFLYLAIFVWPRATISIVTDSNNLNSNIEFTASTGATELDLEERVVPAVRKEQTHSETEQVTATGERDEGTKASGNMTFSIPCSEVSGEYPTIPAGTGVSSNNRTFITQSSVTVNNHVQGPPCRFTGNTRVVAQNNGDQYNLSARSYQIAGGPSGVSAEGGNMSGGTSRIVRIISQEDINEAVRELEERLNNDAVQSELQNELSDEGLKAIAETFNTQQPVVTADPDAGSEANRATVTVSSTSTMLGVNEEDLTALVEEDVQEQIDTDQESILDNGLDEANFVIVSDQSADWLDMTLQTVVQIGPQLDQDALKQEISRQKAGEVINIIESRPGIREVEVDYSPFWVSRAPRNTDKIEFVFEEPPEENGQSRDDDDN